MTTVHLIPVLQDNYAYVIVHGEQSALVDPGEAEPVAAFLQKRGLSPEFIFLTHHHGDHVGGATALKAQYGAQIVAPAAEAGRVEGVDIAVMDGDAVALGTLNGSVIETPGHTAGHVSFYFPSARAAFTGDTLFSLGCGRLFEGTPEQMWSSLQKLAALPGDTEIYCGHEYTESNGLFALEADPDNVELVKRMVEVRSLRAAGLPTLPVTLAAEKATNPFLRAGSAQRFAELRKWKDSF
jgi:hydroxyacylglutathione hydrolase